MEKRDQKILEIFLGLILIIMLIIMILLFTSSASTGKTISTVTNSYNTYNYYQRPSTQFYFQKDCNTMEKQIKKPLEYSSRKEIQISKGVFGNEIKSYVVYVKNKEDVGGYFTVRFYFYDYYEGKRSQLTTKYIQPNEEEAFVFKTIKKEPYGYNQWTYEVFSNSNVLVKTYANECN
ncbi:MAG: hypothetical protein KKF68_00685 [Nanoarchaeota archaeon]|nr:hypothetical protein [Nanoarchaeota archaeon]